MTKERVEAIRAAVCRCAGIEVEDLTGSRRYRDMVIARWVLAGVLRNEGMPMSAIARQLCRNHSTVLWALDRLEDALLTRERDVTALWLEVMHELNTDSHEQ